MYIYRMYINVHRYIFISRRMYFWYKSCKRRTDKSILKVSQKFFLTHQWINIYSIILWD